MLLATLPCRPDSALSAEAAASAVRMDRDVRLALTGVAARRAGLLGRASASRYRAALGAATLSGWQRFARALGAVLRAADAAPPEAASADAFDARRRLRDFLTENPDLSRNRAFARQV
jgi:hypothetical protein